MTRAISCVAGAGTVVAAALAAASTVAAEGASICVTTAGPAADDCGNATVSVYPTGDGQFRACVVPPPPLGGAIPGGAVVGAGESDGSPGDAEQPDPGVCVRSDGRVTTYPCAAPGVPWLGPVTK